MKKLLALVLFSACSSDSNATTEPDAHDPGPMTDAAVDATPVTPWYTSGSRIKLRTLNTPDGARQYLGWRDTLYGDDCEFRKATDGVTRCLPLDVTPHLSAYSDPACSLPAVILFACNPAPKYIQAMTVTPACASTTITTYGTVWLRGQQITTVYQKNGSCNVFNLDVTLVAYKIGTEIPLGDWQSAAVGVDP